MIRDRCQILLQVLSEFEGIHYLLVSIKLPRNLMIFLGFHWFNRK